MVSLQSIQNNKKKFITTMVIIMISATLFNYGLFSFLSELFKPTVDSVYNVVQINIIFSAITIGFIIFIMFILMPKEQINNALMELEGGAETLQLTPEQELSNMLEYELDDEEKK